MRPIDKETELPTPSAEGTLTGAIFKPLQREAEITKTRRNLPHWTQPGVTHYITFRLADSLPATRVRQWVVERDSWLKHHPEPWSPKERAEYTHIFHQRVEKWLDVGSGDCILARPEVSEIVNGALHHFDGQRYNLDDYIIMPNHVHVLVAIGESESPPTVLHSWKSYTAHAINKSLGRSGPVWQDESFDHIVRSEEQLRYFRSYIRENPKKARISGGFRLGRGFGVEVSGEKDA